MRTALTIAGSDSGGGAGIQADLKSFAAVGVHGTSVITCVTAQNTRAVTSIFPLPADEVRAQLRAVLDDFEVRGAKTGMLYSAEIVQVVARELRATSFPLVVDPVMVATVGASLEKDDFRDALALHLLGRADLVTPNRHEAERLAGIPVKDVEAMEEAAHRIHGLGARAVLVKGGHVGKDLVDVLFDGKSMKRLPGHRYDKDLHGAGCTLAASIAGYLAMGHALSKAVDAARRRVAAGFQTSYRAGKGVEIINSQYREDRYAVAHATTEAAAALTKILAAAHRKDDRWQIAYAVPEPRSEDDVATIHAGAGPGAGPSFGEASDAARAVLAMASVNPWARSAILLKGGWANAHRPKEPGLAVVHVDRAAGQALERAVVGNGVIPDAVTVGGGRGREAITLVLGQDPEDALTKLRRLAREAKA